MRLFIHLLNQEVTSPIPKDQSYCNESSRLDSGKREH